MRQLLTIAGPDGAGKTSVVTELIDRLAQRGPVEHHHHRIDALPRSEASRIPTDRPHDQVCYSQLVSVAKIAFLYLEWILAWLLTPVRLPGRGWTVLERGWWDLLVDPRRYRLQPHPRLVEALGRARPGKGTVVVLEAPAEVLHRRKQELPVDEIARQLALWRDLAGRHRDIHLIDVDRPVDAIADDILATVAPGTTARPAVDGPATGPAPERWVRLSTRAHHWYLPTRNPAASRGSLLIHQPMRRRAQLAWRVAAATAGSGVLRMLPAHELPPVHRLIVPHIPPGGTVAISTRRVGTRSMALTLDADGRPHAFVKLADTDVGRARLASEVAAVRRFGPLLPPNVTAPEVLHAEPGLVVFEAARWKVRPEPWRLDPELAHAMGRFFALAGDTDDDTGPAHGDFAPWNVMRLDDGWCLIDWEEATDGRPPFEDPFHYVVQACTLLGRPHEDEIFDGLRLEGPVGEVFSAYADGAGIGTDALPERFRHYLEQTTDWDPEARGRLQVALASQSPPGTR